MKAAIDKTVDGLKSHVDSQVQMVINNLTASLQVIEAAKDSIDEKIKEALSGKEFIYVFSRLVYKNV